MSATLAEVLAEAVHEALENCLHLDERNIPGGGRQCAAYANRIAPAMLAWLEGLLSEQGLKDAMLEGLYLSKHGYRYSPALGAVCVRDFILAAAREGVRDE